MHVCVRARAPLSVYTHARRHAYRERERERARARARVKHTCDTCHGFKVERGGDPTIRNTQNTAETVHVEVERGSPDGHEIVFHNHADESPDRQPGDLKELKVCSIALSCVILWCIVLCYGVLCYIV